MEKKYYVVNFKVKNYVPKEGSPLFNSPFLKCCTPVISSESVEIDKCKEIIDLYNKSEKNENLELWNIYETTVGKLNGEDVLLGSKIISPDELA